MISSWKYILTLRRFNDALSIFIFCLSLYIFAVPIQPRIAFWWKQKTNESKGYAYQTKLEPAIVSKPIPQDNRLVIPSLFLDESINEGTTIAALRKGAWRRPQTAKPTDNSNTVIVGHRFTYSEKAVFYNLDKIQLKDTLIVYWEGKEYDYIVDEIVVVAPSAVEVEAPTSEPRLTLYTCTPIWSAKQRLVVKARLIES